MAEDSNTSTFVKTYGKPRHTQVMGRNSLWNDDFNDEFDKCFGIEDVPHTTFISPESVGSVSMYKPSKYIKNDENQMNSIGGWSLQLHSTFVDHRNNSSMKKRNKEYSLDSNCKKKKPLFKSAEKKKKCSFITNNSKAGVTTTSIKKLKRKFILCKEQCSTPLQKSILFDHGSKFNSISSKKRKKTISKKNLVSTFNSSELSKDLEHSHLNSSSVLMNTNDKYNNPFDQSVQISGSHFTTASNNELRSKNKYSQNSISNNQYLKIPDKLCRVKKKNSSRIQKNSNWYKNAMNIFSDNELSTLEKSTNQDIINTEEHTNICTYEPVITNEIKKLKSLEEQKQSLPLANLNNISFQSFKHYDKSSSGKENPWMASLNLSKSNRENSIITIDKTKERITEESQPYYVSSCENSLYVSSCQLDKSKVIEDSKLQNFNCASKNNLNDKPSINKPKSEDLKLPQLNQYETQSIYKNSTHMLQNNVKLFLNDSYNSRQDYSKESSADHLDFKLLNIFDRINYNKHCTNSQNNQASLLSVDANIGLQSDDDQFVYCTPDFKSKMLLDVTTKFSDIKIDQCDESIIKESSFKKFDHTLDLSVDTSIVKHDISNIFQNSSNLEQDTVIYKHNVTEMLHTTEIADYNNLLLNYENVELKTSPKEDSFKYNNESSGDTNLSNNEYINSDQTLITLCDHKTIHHKINLKTELFNTDDGFSKNLDVLLSDDTIIDDQSICSLNQLENSCISFENRTQIKCEEKSYNKEHIIFSDNELNESNVSVTMPRRKRYAARFQCLDIIEESNQLETILPEQITPVIHLQPGKKWRRSISIVRSFMDRNFDQSINTKGRKWANTVKVLQQQSINTSIYQKVDQSNVLKSSMCSSSQYFLDSTSIDTSIYQNSMGQSNQSDLHRNSIDLDLENQKARSYILNACNQEQLIPFESWLKPKFTKKWKKVGEGVYGEVFSYSSGNRHTIVKIIPIEGEMKINSEQQKKMFEVYSEIVIATELNKLWNKSNWNQTSSFCKLKCVSCVKGNYPNILINCWEQYDDDKGSDNDNPKILPKDQMFMILEMENGGIDVENFIFNSADQSLFAFLQIVLGLAVAEEAYMFEHRDLHIGNILVKKCSNQKISYELEGENVKIPSRGIKITIIDFTLSRMTYNSKHIYNDLSKDIELFTATGDYQFDIYRKMKKKTDDQWKSFTPATNVFWLHYVLDKMLKSVHYKKTTTVLHKNGLSNLERLKNVILSYESAKSFAKSDLILELIRSKESLL